MEFTTAHLIKPKDTQRMKGKASGFLSEVNGKLMSRGQMAKATGFTRGKIYRLLNDKNMTGQQIIDKYGITDDPT